MHTTEQLAKLVAIEHAFVAVYADAVNGTSDPYVRQQLEECQRSHLMRVDILREEIEDLDGVYDENVRDRDITLGANCVGESAMLARLHVIEKAGLASYRTRANDPLIDFDVRDLVAGDIEPEQERTLAIVESLRQEH